MQPRVMGILNGTPDSFYDGGRYYTPSDALKQAEKMLADGASMIDIGAYSSRPGATDIPAAEETKRLLPIINAVRKAFPQAIISADTFRAEVAEKAVDAGADMINDISGGDLDPNMFAAVGRMRVPYILMHMKGTPQTMAQQTTYTDVVGEVCDHLLRRIRKLNEAGVTDIIIDPGFGFAKTAQQSFRLLKNLYQLTLLGMPVLAGISRKSMIYKTLGITAGEALNGTTAANTIALMNGASILRVHDVKEAVQAVKLVGMITENR